MGEAKRRKLLDPNYGRAGYLYRERKAQLDYPHLVVDIPSPLPTAVAEYESHIRAIVAEHHEALMDCVLSSRKEVEEELCLIAGRSPTNAKHLKMAFYSITGARLMWQRKLRSLNQSDAMNVDELFAVALSKLVPEQFLWAHLDIAKRGIWARLVPINDSDITSVCRENERS